MAHNSTNNLLVCVTLYITSEKVGDKGFCVSTHEVQNNSLEIRKRKESQGKKGENMILIGSERINGIDYVLLL